MPSSSSYFAETLENAGAESYRPRLHRLYVAAVIAYYRVRDA
jgi:hypothetical protein